MQCGKVWSEDLVLLCGGLECLLLYDSRAYFIVFPVRDTHLVEGVQGSLNRTSEQTKQKQMKGKYNGTTGDPKRGIWRGIKSDDVTQHFFPSFFVNILYS